MTAEFNGDAEFPPIEQGTQELLGLLAALIVLLLVFRTFAAPSIPLFLALDRARDRVHPALHPRRLTDINTITPLLVSMIGIGVGIDYSLFIVTRFRQLLHEGLSPADAAAEAGASAGRAVLFAGLTVAISVTGLAFFGLDFVTKLGIGSALGVLTTVLIANSLLIAVLAKLGHKVDRLKVPFLRQIDDSDAAREQTLIARWGRFVTAHPSRCSSSSCSRGRAAGTSALVRLGASDQGTQPTKQTARRAYDLLAEGFGAGFNGPIPIVVDVNGDEQAPQRVYDGVRNLDGVASAGEPQFNDPEDGRARLRDPRLGAAGRADRGSSSTSFATTSCPRRPRAATRPSTSRASTQPSSTSATGSWSGCRSSCSTSSASRSSCSRWRSARS